MFCDAVRISCGVQQIWDINHKEHAKNICQVVQDRIFRIKGWYKNQNDELQRWYRQANREQESAKFILENCWGTSLFPAMFIFSDCDELGAGIKFAKYITESGLGTITEAGPAFNTNSSHQIRVWVWTVNKEALRDFFKKQVKAGLYEYTEPVE